MYRARTRENGVVIHKRLLLIKWAVSMVSAMSSLPIILMWVLIGMTAETGHRGEVQPDMMGHIKALDTYTEVSPSGFGFKSICCAKLPGGGHHSEQIGVFEKV